MSADTDVPSRFSIIDEETLVDLQCDIAGIRSAVSLLAQSLSDIDGKSAQCGTAELIERCLDSFVEELNLPVRMGDECLRYLQSGEWPEIRAGRQE